VFSGPSSSVNTWLKTAFGLAGQGDNQSIASFLCQDAARIEGRSK